jgi:hypothetical protein
MRSIEFVEGRSLQTEELSRKKSPTKRMENYLSEYFRLPEDLRCCFLHHELTGAAGFFRFGSETICYGRCESGPTAKAFSSQLYDALPEARTIDRCVRLPFDPAEVIENLRGERYLNTSRPHTNSLMGNALIRKIYYGCRKFLPLQARRQVQRLYFKGWREVPFPRWPVDFTVDTLHEHLLRLSMNAMGTSRVPFIWFWPDGAPGCLLMTHDVETARGVGFASTLMDIDEAHGIKASFQVVPAGQYEVRDDFVQEIRKRGFELNVHDLNHDGSLFENQTQFLHQASQINEHIRAFQSLGFRSGAMYRNQEWFKEFDILYDMSVPNVAHLEPQHGGCCTVMPYQIGEILELPLTMTQDYSLFHILGDYSIGLWKKECDQILGRNGLLSFIVHPDYLVEKRARKVYLDLLNHLSILRAQRRLWTAFPRDVDCWWRNRSQMKLVRDGDQWHIEGTDKDRARIAYATLEGDRLIYSLGDVS